MDLSSLCKSAPVSAAPDMHARHAAQEMGRLHIGCLPVVEDGRLVGMLTDRDLALRCLAGGLGSEVRVGEIMSRDVVTLPATAGLAEAAELMRDHVFRRLPIVDADGRLVGLVAADDLLRTLAREIGQMAEIVEEEMVREAAARAATEAGQ